MKINFVNDTAPNAFRVGFSVFSDCAAIEQAVLKNCFNHDLSSSYVPLSDVARCKLLDKGINIPFMNGYVPNPVYVIAFRDSFLAVPLRMVQFIAATYQEIYDQAEAYKSCPREELAASVTSSMESYAKELGYFNLDFRIGPSMDFNMVAGDYAVHFDFSNLMLEVMFEQKRHFGTIDYILGDLNGERNATTGCCAGCGTSASGE